MVCELDSRARSRVQDVWAWKEARRMFERGW